MFSFFKKEKWTHLKTLEYPNIVWAQGTPHEKLNGTIYIHFYESNKGNRRIEANCSFFEATQAVLDSYVKSSQTYQTRFIRWLSGRYDPEIPKYSDIAEEDTANALRGKIE
jgi:hypothetical protein